VLDISCDFLLFIELLSINLSFIPLLKQVLLDYSSLLSFLDADGFDKGLENGFG
jgi:hypothetical protein